MCDYSLHHVASRPAKVEDNLVVTKFSNSITRGFAAVGEPNVAVCLLPGTEIAFDHQNVECEPPFGIGMLPNKKIGQRLAAGAKPSDMPIEQSPRFYMAVNLKTAASLGVSLSDVFVARANEVRE